MKHFKVFLTVEPPFPSDSTVIPVYRGSVFVDATDKRTAKNRVRRNFEEGLYGISGKLTRLTTREVLYSFLSNEVA